MCECFGVAPVMFVDIALARELNFEPLDFLGITSNVRASALGFLQLGIDEVGDFTNPVVKLPTLVTLKLAYEVGDVGTVIYSFSFSFFQKLLDPGCFG